MSRYVDTRLTHPCYDFISSHRWETFEKLCPLFAHEVLCYPDFLDFYFSSQTGEAAMAT